MRRLTCDDAFEALTGPSEFSAADLERHLAACARCREMSEVLGPALALFAGVAPAEPACRDDSGAAAGDWAQESRGPRLLSTAALRAADEAARQLTASRSRRDRSVSVAGALRIAAVFLLGVATAFGVASLGSDGGRGASAPATNDGSCLWVSADARLAENETAERVILSCVACHLPESAAEPSHLTSG